MRKIVIWWKLVVKCEFLCEEEQYLRDKGPEQCKLRRGIVQAWAKNPFPRWISNLMLDISASVNRLTWCFQDGSLISLQNLSILLHSSYTSGLEANAEKKMVSLAKYDSIKIHLQKMIQLRLINNVKKKKIFFFKIAKQIFYCSVFILIRPFEAAVLIINWQKKKKKLYETSLGSLEKKEIKLKAAYKQGSSFSWLFTTGR